MHTLPVAKHAKPDYRTKEGEHGTLYRYTIEYADADPGFPPSYWSCWAYSREHALDKFEDGDDGFVAKKIARQTMHSGEVRGPGAWKWSKCA